MTVSNNNLLYCVIGLKSELELENAIYPRSKIIFEIDDETNQSKLKVGDGVTTYQGLNYLGGGSGGGGGGTIPETRRITATGALTGGGTLASDISLGVNVASDTIYGVTQLNHDYTATNSNTAASSKALGDAYSDLIQKVSDISDGTGNPVTVHLLKVDAALELSPNGNILLNDITLSVKRSDEITSNSSDILASTALVYSIRQSFSSGLDSLDATVDDLNEAVQDIQTSLSNLNSSISQEISQTIGQSQSTLNALISSAIESAIEDINDEIALKLEDVSTEFDGIIDDKIDTILTNTLSDTLDTFKSEFTSEINQSVSTKLGELNNLLSESIDTNYNNLEEQLNSLNHKFINIYDTTISTNTNTITVDPDVDPDEIPPNTINNLNDLYYNILSSYIYDNEDFIINITVGNYDEILQLDGLGNNNFIINIPDGTFIDKIYLQNGSFEINGNLECRKFTVQNAYVNINNNVTIIDKLSKITTDTSSVTSGFYLTNNASLILGSSTNYSNSLIFSGNLQYGVIASSNSSFYFYEKLNLTSNPVFSGALFRLDSANFYAYSTVTLATGTNRITGIKFQVISNSLILYNKTLFDSITSTVTDSFYNNSSLTTRSVENIFSSISFVKSDQQVYVSLPPTTKTLYVTNNYTDVSATVSLKMKLVSGSDITISTSSTSPTNVVNYAGKICIFTVSGMNEAASITVFGLKMD
jgi:uncharacterized protein YoxC